MTLVFLCTSLAFVGLGDDDYFHWSDAFVSESEPHTNVSSSVIMVYRFGRSLERVFYHFSANMLLILWKQPLRITKYAPNSLIKNCIHRILTDVQFSPIFYTAKRRVTPMISATLLITISLRHIDGRPDRNSIPKMFDLPRTCYIILCFVLSSSLRECLLYCIFLHSFCLFRFASSSKGRVDIPASQLFRFLRIPRLEYVIRLFSSTHIS